MNDNDNRRKSIARRSTDAVSLFQAQDNEEESEFGGKFLKNKKYKNL